MGGDGEIFEFLVRVISGNGGWLATRVGGDELLNMYYKG